MRRLTATLLPIVVALAALAPIRSYDAFWHLATGRWIVEHRALPRFDPFALASAHVPWINGEWLYEIVLFAVHAIGGVTAISWMQALLVAAIVTSAFWFASRTHDVTIALLVASVAFAGASDRLGVRPSSAAALLLVIAIAVVGQRSWSIRTTTIAYAIVTIVWINVHPSALLAPIVAGMTMLFDRKRWMVMLASAAALLVNPFGIRGITAPLELTSLVGSGAFVNAEWLPSPPALFPLLYATIVAVALLFALTPRRRDELWRLAIFAMLAVLAIRHVRNQGLYFAALPLLLPPLRWTPARLPRIALAVAALLPLAWAYTREAHTTGVDAHRFPVHAVARLKAANLPGNIYDVDQFGGYLIWTFYPQRRVTTDGRNELYRDFIELDARAHADSRAWHALLQDYRIDIAVDEYAPPLAVMDVQSGTRRELPASMARYRRRDWALIAFDDAAMIFARRAAFPPDVIARLEYATLIPDAPSLRIGNDPQRVKQELERAKRELVDSDVVRRMEAAGEY